MTKILIFNRHKKGPSREKVSLSTKEDQFSRVNFMKSKSGSARISLISAGFFLFFLLVGACAFYLFQVNDLAVKGYAIRELENKISELEKENKQMQIREMELRSMYVIEKSAGNFNLVSPVNISYVEINNTVAVR
jgi:hypothetical protein